MGRIFRCFVLYHFAYYNSVERLVDHGWYRKVGKDGFGKLRLFTRRKYLLISRSRARRGEDKLQSAYRPELWREAFVMLGGASAALAGLIIVAVSVRADQLTGAPHLWMRGRNNTMSMISLTVASLLLLFPQPPTLAGAEMVALTLLSAAMLPGRWSIITCDIEPRCPLAFHSSLCFSTLWQRQGALASSSKEVVA